MYSFSGFINESNDNREISKEFLETIEELFNKKGFKYSSAFKIDGDLIMITMYESCYKFYDEYYFEEIKKKWEFLNIMSKLSFEYDVRKAEKGDDRYIEIKIDISDMKELNDPLWKSLIAKNKFNL